MINFPHCKINLGLHVVSKRSDGYHNIETCFYPVPRTDVLEIIRSDEFSFSQSGLTVSGKEEDNLCVKAHHLIKKNFGIGNVKIHLHKAIPMGAGLGGGSANGAFVLRLLNSIFGLKISHIELENYASQLGSDCAFFVDDQPKLGTGRGETLKPTVANLKGYYAVLVKPDVQVSTAEAYAGIVPKQPDTAIEEILKTSVKEWRSKLTNDFEEAIFKKHPIIGQVKENLYSLGAAYASMSGSGACVYGIFEKPVDQKKDFSGMGYWSGELK